MFKPCVIIPVYDHEKPLPAIVARLKPYGLPCLLVDDGSHAPCRHVMKELAAQEPWLSYLGHAHNLGKGAAVKTGLRGAAERGYTHAVQIDADGQHDLDDLPKFLRTAAGAPDAMVIGQALFDASIPRHRYYARYLTHIWVWINTLSFSIPDSMCGFRVYPLKPCLRLMEQHSLGDRMQWDSEILIHLHWDDVRIISLPTRVRYPEDGLSHFRLWQDNVGLSLMQAKQFGMLAPRLLQRLWKRTQ